MKKMEYNEILEFIKSIENHSDKEIVENVDYINDYLRKVNCRDYAYKFLKMAISVIRDIDIKSDLIINYFFKNNLNQMDYDELYNTFNWEATRTVLDNSSDTDKKKAFIKMFRNISFQEIRQKINIPDTFKFGVEIEVANTSFENIKKLFENNMINQIMEALNVPQNLADNIIENTDFEKENQFDKWIFSNENVYTEDAPEASSPIMKNTLENLNQISIICTLFKILGAQLHGGTGLHINIGADYFEGREDALTNLLIIWGECEELFFKISNEENEKIRVKAKTMALPIKENIEKTLKDNKTIKLNNDEDFNRFLYNIQVQNRLKDLLEWNHRDLKLKLMHTKTDEEKYDIYKRYMKEKDDNDTAIRYTSINFNHMTWNKKDDRGRIEFRLFNSTLSPETIMQNLLLVGKLCEVSLATAKNPEYKDKEFKKLLCHNVSEEEKVNRLLDLLFDTQQEKQIFKNRWKSVKDESCYKQFKTGKNTYQIEREI